MEYCFVNSKVGKIKGIKEENALMYRNIPYIKTSRFEDPVFYGDLSEFDGTGRCVNCHQRFEYYDESKEGEFYYKEFDYTRDSDFNEEYQTLNITTPINSDNCPVIIYFHGGSFENGCNNDEPFGSSQEYAKRDVILVSVGYRLNIFGLYDSENFGLKDMLASIKWVKDNIAEFGGNPENITIMGQSAGAIAVSMLLKDKEDIQPLIKGAVMISGIHVMPDMIGPRTKEVNSWFWKAIMEDCGVDNEQQLKQVDAEKLWRSWYKIKNEKGNFHVTMPSVDGTILKDIPKNIANQNKDADVPLLMGVTSQDMFPFMIFEALLKGAKRHYKNKKSPAYCYFFDRTLPGNYFKAFHASDLWYFFGNMKISWRPFEKHDFDLSKMMIDYVANFATNQNPNGNDLPNWERFTTKNKFFRYFGDDLNKNNIKIVDCRKKMFNSLVKDKGPF